MQNIPGVPASGAFCDEHVPEYGFQPLPCLLLLVVLALVGLAAWLVFRGFTA